ncbi:hypothetical protein [Dyella sp. C9]|uniref:hypothetical protein n=1 Tax=Dyella sp. C9 TaxID=2202154 RepID=UPI000DEF2021|nr:hypothetical protein [Dyella sp. C9]
MRPIRLDILPLVVPCFFAGALGAGHITLWAGRFSAAPLAIVFVVIFGALIATCLRYGTSSAPGQGQALPLRVRDHLPGLLLGVLLPLALRLPTFLNAPAGGDALAYHLPMAAQWVQQGSMLASDARCWFYPGNMELLLAEIFVLTRHDTWWALLDVLSWLWLYGALHSLMARMCDKRTAGLVVAAIMLSPVFVNQLGQAGNDLFLSAAILSAFVALLAYLDKPSLPGWIICAGWISVVLGTKYVGLPVAAVLCVPLLYSLWQHKDVRRPKLAIAAVPLALLGASFYLRNALLTGNPLYPSGVSLLGHSLLPWGDTGPLVAVLNTVVPMEMRATSFFGMPQHLHALMLGLRACWEHYLLLPGVVMTVLATWLCRVVNPALPRAAVLPGRAQAWLWAVALVILALYFTMPFTIENIPGTANQISNGASLRLAQPALALLVAAAIACAPVSAVPVIAASALAYDGINLMMLNAPAMIAIEAAGLPLLLVLVWTLDSGHERARDSVASLSTQAFGVAAALFVAGALWRTTSNCREVCSANMYTYGGKTKVAQWLLQPERAGSTIAATMTLRIYPLVGHRFQNRVIALNPTPTPNDMNRAIAQAHARFIVISRETGDVHSPTFGEWPDPLSYLPRLESRGYRLVFDDGFAKVFAGP